MSKGKIIAFEGLDCSFKETQSFMLDHKLKSMGYNTTLISFPRYDTASGGIIFHLLRGGYGDINNLSPQLIGDCYSIDRALSWYKDIKDKYDNGSIIIFDRWMYSNIYNATRSCRESENSDELRSVMMSYIVKEHNVYKLPLPDITLHMDMPIETTIKLLTEKKNKDANELDLGFLTDVFRMSNFFYNEVMKDNPTIAHIRCVDDKGKILSREDIHDNIMDNIKYILKEN